MSREEIVLNIVLNALNDLNEELADDEKVVVDINTCLFGVDATLDSLSLVSVIVDVETAIAIEVGRAISLTDDRAMNQEISPFTDVRALTTYINQLLAE